MKSEKLPLIDDLKPFAPDENGYCYRNRDHFDEITRVISHRLILKHGSFFDRLPLWVMFIFFIAMIITFVLASSFLPIGWSTLTQLLCLVLAIWYSRRIRRFVKTIIRKRMCFKCGYILRQSPTDSAGFGKCSECGQEFYLGYYRHLPHGYKRQWLLPNWRENLHPLDRARMERDESQTTDI